MTFSQRSQAMTSYGFHEGATVAGEIQGTRTKAVSTVGGYRSAIVDFYKANNMRLDPELDIGMSNYIAGFKRNVADLKDRGYMKIQEGRAPLTFSGYVVLAREIMTQVPEGRSASWQQSIFAWPFFIFCWNLMARSCSVGNLMLQHIKWSNDALVCTLPKHKGDQRGDKIVDRHIYSNPMKPEVCPILSLGVLLICKPFRVIGGKQQVFEGDRTECRFSELLSKLLRTLPESKKILLGTNVNDLGTHSPRKGAFSYTLSMVGGPNPVQVFLRAGWSLGNVQDRYLFAGDGGDQLTGRCVSGLGISDDGFAILPPHFSDETVIELQQHWDEIIPGKARILIIM
jgi:hypothetical protein